MNGLRRQVAATVPLHSSPTQVVAYLNAQKITHSPYKREAKMGNTIEATVLVPAPHTLVQPSYDVIFRFDDRDSLTAYDVEYLGYIGL